MLDSNFYNPLHNGEFDSDSYEKRQQLFRLMAHISFDNGGARMPAALQQGVKTSTNSETNAKWTTY